MTSGDFQSKSGASLMLSPSSGPASPNVGQDSVGSAEAGQNVIASAQRSQSGFLNQSIDEIARLYVEAPFSW